MEYGCIAEKLGHSFSKIIHAKIDNYSYELRELPKDALHDFMTRRDFKGINVTIPYKQDVIPYLDAISETARAIGAVNTVCSREGKLYGYNTDFSGMTALLRKVGVSLQGKKVLILGTGGTSKTAFAVAQSQGAAAILRVSRTPDAHAVGYDALYQNHTDAQVVINTTPVGMFPKADACPLDLAVFDRLEGVIDAIYNPLRTDLVLSAQAKGIPASGGLYMLVSQAVAAAEKFTGKTYPADLTDSICDALTLEKQNLVLIGMPSSGKSTLGQMAAKALGRTFVDLDAVITQTDGRPIPQIFAEDGERFFRDLEAKAVQEIAMQNGLVIATGGGCVLRPENVRRLKRNGKLILLDRPLGDLLPTDDRPTANSAEKIKALYTARTPIYRDAAECSVPIGEDVTKNAANVLRAFKGEL